MAFYTERLPERKASKRSAINFTPADAGPATLVIHTDRASVSYTVTEFPVDWDGRGFVLDKDTDGTDTTEEMYCVFVGRNRQDRRCDCKGFAFAGHCKHTDALF